MITEIVFILYGVLVLYLFLAWIILPMIVKGALYNPTPSKRIRQALELCELKRDDVFYDLGSGMGDVIAEASKLCDNVNGIEIEPFKYLASKLLLGKRANVKLGDLYKADLNKATVVFLFQYKGKINKAIGEKLQRELKKGARVVSYKWEIAEWAYIKQIDNKLYLYII
jgi:16S rRNA A1518/A1519 N6-dimethyltransferase RsmA/KsgA/DIM1 with predicted DNA glycosylase/AP lyase activity